MAFPRPKSCKTYAGVHNSNGNPDERSVRPDLRMRRTVAGEPGEQRYRARFAGLRRDVTQYVEGDCRADSIQPEVLYCSLQNVRVTLQTASAADTSSPCTFNFVNVAGHAVCATGIVANAAATAMPAQAVGIAGEYLFDARSGAKRCARYPWVPRRTCAPGDGKSGSLARECAAARQRMDT